VFLATGVIFWSGLALTTLAESLSKRSEKK
jgi:hypothetical protein